MPLFSLFFLAILLLFGLFSDAGMVTPTNPETWALVDQASWWGIPCGANVFGNLMISLAAGAGLLMIGRVSKKQEIWSEGSKPHWVLFFVCVGLGGLLDILFHHLPSMETLALLRLAIAGALMSLFSALLVDRAPPGILRKLPPWLLLLAAVSVGIWYGSERLGMEDDRLYLAMIIYPTTAFVLLVGQWPSSYSGNRILMLGWILFLLACTLDLLDAQVFLWTAGLVSGHTLSLIGIALATWCMGISVLMRRPLELPK